MKIIKSCGISVFRKEKDDRKISRLGKGVTGDTDC